MEVVLDVSGSALRLKLLHDVTSGAECVLCYFIAIRRREQMS